MKRELKVEVGSLEVGSPEVDRKAHPDEKGTESPIRRLAHDDIIIARPIPMKRELKGLNSATASSSRSESQGPSR